VTDDERGDLVSDLIREYMKRKYNIEMKKYEWFPDFVKGRLGYEVFLEAERWAEAEADRRIAAMPPTEEEE